jgi:carbon monoxide dehydrogenase subunit G
MELHNDFQVKVPIGDTWSLLTDVERVAPCLPGAQLQEIDGDQFKGIVKVKVGPISVQYRGTASFVEQDGNAHRLVIHAQGRETKGQGNATADVTVTLTQGGDTTNVDVRTELNVTGKVAQFGRGVMADVSDRLISQFVANLETLLEAPDDEPEPERQAEPVGGLAAAAAGDEDQVVDLHPVPPAVTPPSTTTPVDAGRPPGPERTGPATGGDARRVIAHPEPEPIDLLSTAGAPMVKRLAPAIGGVVAVLVALRLRRGRARRRRG